MGRKPKIIKKKFKEACKGSGGVQAIIAQRLGVTRQSLSTYLKKNPELIEKVEEELDIIIDIAERNIDREIIAGDVEISKWALLNRKRGKARGYGPKQELEHEGEIQPAIFNLTTKSNEEIRSEKFSLKQRGISNEEVIRLAREAREEDEEKNLEPRSLFY